jgi:hypothetical protein
MDMNEPCIVPQVSDYVWANMLIAEKWAGNRGSAKMDSLNIRYWMTRKFRSTRHKHRSWAGV